MQYIKIKKSFLVFILVPVAKNLIGLIYVSFNNEK